MRHAGFLLPWFLLLQSTGSRRVGPLAVVNGGSAAQQDLPGPGMEPVSPASAGGFLSVVSLGKKSPYRLLKHSCPLPLECQPLL